ncbi:hypothetical protein ACFL21_04585 [Patescibacteria group bacterium]
MKKILFIFVISLLTFCACTEGTTTEDKEVITDTKTETETTEQEEKAEDPEDIAASMEDCKDYELPELNVNITFPQEYAVSRNAEENRRGSFLSYDFDQGNILPSYQEIQFFSEESIVNFSENCGDTPCFFGDYPDLARYQEQKQAYTEGKDCEDFKLKEFEGGPFFVSNSDCEGDSCVIREYTTFLGDTKVDVWITMEDESQVQQADQLFEKFKITE